MKGRDNLKDLGVDGIIIFNRYEENRAEVWTGFMWLRLGSSDLFL
jgi:hypothetical protein